MKTYIINLERSVERRQYMEEQLKDSSFLSVEYVSAVDGRTMSDAERQTSFDDIRFQKRNSTIARPGEVGCTLSHQKCYRKMAEENEAYVLILEDDIQIPQHIDKIIGKVEELMKTSQPLIILFSGWYWYGRTFPLTDNYRLANVYDAFLTHSYAINQAAARLLIEERPYITADDWLYIRKKQIRLQAILPHVIGQNWTGELATTVNVEPKKRKSLVWYGKNIGRLVILRILSMCGHFEKPD